MAKKKKFADEVPEMKEDFNKVLLQAVYNRDFAIVQFAIKMGADVDAQDDTGYTALAKACNHKASMEIAKFLLENGANIEGIGKNEPSYDIETPLTHASMYGELELVKFLLDSGADVNKVGGYGRTPLHFAATPSSHWSNDFPEIVKVLLEHGADPNIAHGGGDNPLMEAIWGEEFDIEIAKMLIEYGTDLEFEGSYDGTALSRAAEKGRNELVDLITESLGKDKLSPKILKKALLDAMSKDKKEMVWKLLKQGEGKFDKDMYRVNVLAYTARKGHTDIVEYLFEQGLDPSKDDVYYALGDAAYYNQLEIVKMLIEGGFDTLSYDYGAADRPLLKAARHGYMEMAKYLLDKGADIDVQDYKGNSTLSLAVWEGKLEMVKFLISKDVNVDLRNEHNWNALMQAIHQGYYDIAELLIEKGSDLNAVDGEQGATPLMLAAHFGFEKIVKHLLEKGADKSIKNKKGETATDTAHSRGYTKIAQFIEEY